MAFLPNQYEVPEKEGNYMKFKQGENRFRILSSPIVGWLWWDETPEGRRPVRVHMDDEVPVNKAEDTKHFWAMPVWNYQAKKVQILEITQKTIQKYIKMMANNPKWGAPMEYDIVVTKTGEKLETEYTIVADPKEPLEPNAVDRFKHTPVNLNALYNGNDPFEQVDEADQIANDALEALN